MYSSVCICYIYMLIQWKCIYFCRFTSSPLLVLGCFIYSIFASHDGLNRGYSYKFMKRIQSYAKVFMPPVKLHALNTFIVQSTHFCTL